MTAETHSPALVETDVLIVGAGFSGLGMAIRLKQEGRTDFVVLERGADVGGTWHYNTYPGCACDIPSHLYSFSFAPNPNWSNTYSRQPEIRAYLERTATEFGVRPFIRFNTTLERAEWNEEVQRWDVETDRGGFRARVLVSGMGPLTEPKIPDVPGLDSFAGEMFHSARWNHDYDVKGKRVASIGTGASAIQYVPAIAPDVEQLYVFQRTAPWVLPHRGRKVTRLERRLYNAFPPAQKLARLGVYLSREWVVLGFVKNPDIMKLPERLARAHMRRAIKDPELLEKVTPNYKIGCKRILPSNEWYPALARDNVELVTGGIEEVRPNAVVGRDGVAREVDAIVFGTGFHVTDMPGTKLVHGVGGRSLFDAFEGSPRAHMGATVPGFPNLFWLLGPNTGLGHNSIVYMIESQIKYVLDALRTMDERGVQVVDVRREAVEDFNEDLDERMSGTVWSSGCESWYLDDTGRNGTLWPDWTWRFRQRTARFDATNYVFDPKPTRVPVAA